MAIGTGKLFAIKTQTKINAEVKVWLDALAVAGDVSHITTSVSAQLASSNVGLQSKP